MTSGAEVALDDHAETRWAPSQPRVLAVDQDAEHLALITRTLSHHYEVQAETNVFQALVALEEDGPFVLVICDLRTGGVDGVEFLERALEAHPETPRMLVLNEANLADAVEAVNRSRVRALITKPVDPLQLLRRVDEATAECSPTIEYDTFDSDLFEQPVALASG